ncbi:hypothetical protein Nepgr_006655 [Nepenthes gracilis]|uniref:Uncharacterized protein n=1 Tax=Nepenthes gracilis TaxID=150966 RepID=A0AAD3XHM8_NEPGR|nr:hypothetical protein Nepgr_006655 [Nepenthes gracilis]
MGWFLLPIFLGLARGWYHGLLKASRFPLWFYFFSLLASVTRLLRLAVLGGACSGSRWPWSCFRGVEARLAVPPVSRNDAAHGGLHASYSRWLFCRWVVLLLFLVGYVLIMPITDALSLLKLRESELVDCCRVDGGACTIANEADLWALDESMCEGSCYVGLSFVSFSAAWSGEVDKIGESGQLAGLVRWCFLNRALMSSDLVLVLDAWLLWCGLRRYLEGLDVIGLCGLQVLSYRVGLNRSSTGLIAYFGSVDIADDELPLFVAFAGIVAVGSPFALKLPPCCSSGFEIFPYRCRVCVFSSGARGVKMLQILMELGNGHDVAAFVSSFWKLWALLMLCSGQKAFDSCSGKHCVAVSCDIEELEVSGESRVIISSPPGDAHGEVAVKAPSCSSDVSFVCLNDATPAEEEVFEELVVYDAIRMDAIGSKDAAIILEPPSQDYAEAATNLLVAKDPASSNRPPDAQVVLPSSELSYAEDLYWMVNEPISEVAVGNGVASFGSLTDADEQHFLLLMAFILANTVAVGKLHKTWKCRNGLLFGVLACGNPVPSLSSSRFEHPDPLADWYGLADVANEALVAGWRLSARLAQIAVAEAVTATVSALYISPPVQILQPKPIGWKWSNRLQTLQPIRGGTRSKASQHRQLQELLFISKIQQQNLQHTALHQQKGTTTKSPKQGEFSSHTPALINAPSADRPTADNAPSAVIQTAALLEPN